MKKIFFVFLVSFLFCSVFAAKKETTVTKQPTSSVIPKLTDEQRATLKQKALETLNSKIWIVNIIEDKMTKPSTYRDVLAFNDGILTSENLISRGFGGSKISISVGDDKRIIWETVQKDKKNSIAMWKGELKGDTIFGALSITSDKGLEMFSFNTISTQPAIKPAAEEVEPTTSKAEVKSK